jgi:glyoxylase I family protein
MSVALQRLNHFAWKCRDAEETRHFYEEILGLPLAHVIAADHVPSTGAYAPYVHIFFEMKDGSYIAFFDIGDGKTTDVDKDTPDWLTHFAFQVDSVDDLKKAKQNLEANGVDVVGITDHGILNSIYFFDPNGLRLEMTTWTVTPEFMKEESARAHDQLSAALKKMRAERPLPPKKPVKVHKREMSPAK